MAFAAMLPAAAGAQEGLPPPPPYPDVPEVTEPLEAALDDAAAQIAGAGEVVVPELGLAVHFLGPTLRPGCSAVSSLVIATVLGGGYFPVRIPAGGYLSPVGYMCTYAYKVGTADYVFGDVDATVGPTVTQVSDTALAPAADSLAPVHEQAATACGYSPLVSSPVQQVPRPLNRLDFFSVACG